MNILTTSFVLGLVGCMLTGSEAAAETPVRSLPAPQREGGVALAEALAERRSLRALRADELGDTQLGQLLWAAQGATDGYRTAPSAGALYPLTLYVADRHGVWRYGPRDHTLVLQLARDQRDAIARACFDQQAVGDAPVLVIITAEVAITARKYGARAERYATLEAGHAAQNLLLTATALGLGSVPIAAFDDAALRRALALDRTVTLLYVVPIGVPR